MSRNLRGRLDRLERRRHAPRVTFWDVLCGAADPNKLEGLDREMWEEIEARGGLYGRPDPRPSQVIEDRIRSVALPAPDLRNPATDES